MLAVRAELPLTRFALVEGGLTAARPDQQFGARTTFLAPEAQLQLQLPVAGRRVAPYVGAGAGAAFDLRRDRFGGTQADLTVSGAGGLRAWLTEQVGLRAELRVRGVGRCDQLARRRRAIMPSPASPLASSTYVDGSGTTAMLPRISPPPKVVVWTLK
jgi:hypothetical protein